MSTRNLTDVHDFMDNCDAGVLIQKLAYALTKVGGACADMDKGGTGTVSLKFDMKCVAEGTIAVKHTISQDTPTINGRSTDKDTTSSTFFVSTNGLVPLNYKQTTLELEGKKSTEQTS